MSTTVPFSFTGKRHSHLFLEQDKLVWTHFQTFRGPTNTMGGEEMMRKEWSYRQYWHTFKHELRLGINPFPYFFTEIWDSNLCPAYTFLTREGDKKMLILSFKDKECRKIIDFGKTYARGDPLDVDPIILRDWEEVPEVKNIDDYMRIVAPFCEALLALFLELYEEQPPFEYNEATNTKTSED